VITVPVELGARRYDVLVGAGAIDRLDEVVPARARRAAIVTQAGIPVDVAPPVDSSTLTIRQGEAAKTMSTVEVLCRGFARAGLTRDDVVIAVGGGVVSDVAGFAAAVYQRGIAYVNVATTLLAQVDAAIGGKTGVNIVEGKNMLGAFWQPAGVLCDTEVLDTLPPREYLSGLGELAKYHFLGAEGLEGSPLDERVARCVELKARVVAGDEREGGLRATLNYGHTLAHALEVAGAFDLRHGEAVGIGLVYAALLARSLGRIDDERVAYHRKVVGTYGLPTALPDDSEADALLALMARDKKRRGAELTFVLDGASGIEAVDVPVEVAREVLVAMGAT
jgi:5-deoxy-5-amino-3-dehydroquinate synthase